uniref:Tc1-like transposase DDE domain-containing protein n=1 Tax=Ditylenchus dipsaci TaxID=166011 RepID=A0A915D535_9BILA
MDAREYQEVFSHSLMPYLHNHSRQKLVYQQDNAGVHVSRNRRRSDPQFVPMMEWFQEQGIELLKWPSVPPDLNLMENFWGIMVRHIFNDGKQYDNEAQLKRAIQKTWNEIQPELIQKLVDSMKDRIFQVIQRIGSTNR